MRYTDKIYLFLLLIVSFTSCTEQALVVIPGGDATRWHSKDSTHPSSDDVMCAMYSENQRWLVTPENGIKDLSERTFVTWFASPEEDGKLFREIGDIPREVKFLQTPGGYYVGLNGGEWGGALYWVSLDKSQSKLILRKPVTAIMSLKGGRTFVFTDLCHLGGIDSSVYKIDEANPFTASKISDFNSCTMATTETRSSSIIFVNSNGLYEIGTDESIKQIYMIDLNDLLVTSIAVRYDGIYIGMHRYILRLIPDGKSFEPEWLVPEKCQNAVLKPMSCDCIQPI